MISHSGVAGYSAIAPFLHLKLSNQLTLNLVSGLESFESLDISCGQLGLEQTLLSRITLSLELALKPSFGLTVYYQLSLGLIRLGLLPVRSLYPHTLSSVFNVLRAHVCQGLLCTEL